jgi:hypothetical protein
MYLRAGSDLSRLQRLYAAWRRNGGVLLARDKPSLLPLNEAALDAESRALVAQTWAFRTRAERESELRFRRVAGELEQTSADPLVVRMARKAAHDEHRHAQLCAAMCVRYGGTLPGGPAHEHPATWPGLGPRDRVLYETVAFCCIAETINAQLLTTILSRARAARVLRVIRRLLKDEVTHGQLGWAHLAAERKRGAGDFLSAKLPHMLASSVAPELFDDAPDPTGEAAIAHGELPRTERVAIFASALRDVLLPGFATFGLDIRPATAWAEQKLGATALRTD